MDIDAPTIEEMNERLAAGCQAMTPAQVEHELDQMGYRINRDLSFRYINNLNHRSFYAYAVYIEDKSNGESFASVESHNPNKAKLQELRLNALVYSRGYLWQL